MSWPSIWFRFAINPTSSRLYTVTKELYRHHRRWHGVIFLTAVSIKKLTDGMIDELLDGRSVSTRWTKFINVSGHPFSTLETDKVTTSTSNSWQLCDQHNVDSFQRSQVEHFRRVCSFFQKNVSCTRNQVEVFISWITLNQKNTRTFSTKVFKKGSARKRWRLVSVEKKQLFLVINCKRNSPHLISWFLPFYWLVSNK